VTTRLLLAAEDGPSSPAAAEAGTVLVMAGVEGLALERLERAEDPALSRARELFVSSASAAIRGT
jgi:hypothetical protein